MAFPGTILDLKAALNLAGTWTDISTYAYQRSSPAVSITRGRADGAQSANPSTAVFELNNRDGRFSPRNPTGAYYGLLGRNTPVRFSVPASGTYLRMEDDQMSRVSAPDSVGLSVTGDTEIQIDVKPSGYVASVLAAKWNETGNQRSWALVLNADGTVTLWWSNDGTATHSAASALPLPVGRIALKVTLAVASGTVTFWTAATIAGSWAQLGPAVVTAATSVFDSTASVTIGADPNYSAVTTGLTGRVYAFRLLNGIGGSTVASPDFTTATPGNATLTDAQANVWTLAGTAEFSARDYRFHGEMADLPQRWDVTGTDVWTPVTAGGLLRRAGQGSPPSWSALRRFWTHLAGTSAPAAYWPCEDAAGAAQFGSALSGGAAMNFAGSPTLASDSGFACSAAVPAVNSSSWNGAPGPYSSNGAIVVRFLLHITAGSAPPDGTVLVQVAATGPYATLKLFYHTGGNLQLTSYDSSGNTLLDTGSMAAAADGALLMVSLELHGIFGPHTELRLSTMVAGTSAVTSSAVNAALVTLGTVQRVQVNPAGAGGTYAIGHIAVQSLWTDLATAMAAPAAAYAGEAAGTRFARLCGERGFACRIYGYPSATVLMGAQLPDTIVNLLQACEDADRGMMFEPRSTLALGYRTSGSLSAQSAAVTLDYPSAMLGGTGTGLEPVDDDRYTRNDVIITRQGGSPATVTLADGSAMSTGSPPGGVGDYQFAQTVSLSADPQASDLANWVMHLGTVNEERYPVIPLNMARPELASQFYAVQDVNLGDYVAVSNPPVFVTFDAVRALVWGITETLGGFVYTIAWQSLPESPYETLVSDAAAARADTDGSTLHANIASGDTLIQVDTTGALSPLWTTQTGDLPFDIVMGGERMTVTNVDGPPGNFLAGNNATFEGTNGNWTGAGNAALSNTIAQAHSGTHAMAMTSSALGNMAAASCGAGSILTQGMACAAGDTVTGSAWLLAATAARTCVIQVGFYTSGGVLVSTLSGTGVADSTSAWTKIVSQFTAPATSAFCRLAVQVQATGAGGEVHYVDDAYLADNTTGAVLTQSFTVTRSVNGVVKAHTAGEAVSLFAPCYAGLA